MKQEKERDVQEFVISDALWTLIEYLVPLHENKVHVLGCHCRRIPDRQTARPPDRQVLNGIFLC